MCKRNLGRPSRIPFDVFCELNCLWGAILNEREEIRWAEQEMARTVEKSLRPTRSKSSLFRNVFAFLKAKMTNSRVLDRRSMKYNLIKASLVMLNNVKLGTLLNAISSRHIRLQDDLVTGFHFSVSERFVPGSALKASIVELIREGLVVLSLRKARV